MKQNAGHNKAQSRQRISMLSKTGNIFQYSPSILDIRTNYQ